MSNSKIFVSSLVIVTLILGILPRAFSENEDKKSRWSRFTSLFSGIRPVAAPEGMDINALLVEDIQSLKGIWYAQHTFQETTATQRAGISELWLPERKEFESEEKYNERINIMKQLYNEKKVARIHEQEKRKGEFADVVFGLTFRSTDTRSNFAQGITCDSEKSVLINRATYYLPGDNIDSYTRETEILNLRFRLGEYNLEENKFPLVFLSGGGDSPRDKFNPQKLEFEYYSRTCPIEGEIYRWIIRFGELPTYIPAELQQAKQIRKNEDDLSLALYFKPTQAVKEEGRYVLEADFTFVVLEKNAQVYYASESGKWKNTEFAQETFSWNEAGWTVEPKYVDADPIDGVNDPGSPSNPWIVKPKDPSYGPTYEVSTKYLVGNMYPNRRRKYHRVLPVPHYVNYVLNFPCYLVYATESMLEPLPKARRFYFRSAEWPVPGYPASMQVLFAPGNPGNPYVVKEVATPEKID